MWLARGLPTGLFDNNAIAAYLSRLLSQPGRTDDFRKLARKLFIVATDLDSGRSAPFGSPGLDEVPISEAVKASAALPGLYPPARIGDRDYVDGALKKTLHASVALKAGAKLLICINPIVPYNGELAAQAARLGFASPSGAFLPCSRKPFARSSTRECRSEWSATPRNSPTPMSCCSSRPRTTRSSSSPTFSAIPTGAASPITPIGTRSQNSVGASTNWSRSFARHGIELDRAALPNCDKGLHATPSQTGALWDSVAPLERTLSRLEKALRRDGRRRSQGTKRHAAKAAPTHA